MTIAIKGLCPTLLDPMESGDGLLVRVKPRAGHLTASQTLLIADLAETHGNGAIELTNRGNLQLRGIATSGLADLAAAIIEADLAHPNPAVERRRNIIAAPFVQQEAIDGLESLLANRPDLDNLPAKFAFAADGGRLPLGETGADLTISEEGGGYRLSAPDLDISGTLSKVLTQVDKALAEPRRSETRTRLRPGEALIGRLLVDACGLGLPFGAGDATTFRRLAALATTFGDGILRLTPRRAVILAGLRAPDALLRAAVGAFVIDLADPRLRVIACPGGPACTSASVPARADALRLATSVPADKILHVSGCAKGCAHPGIADLTLTGNDGCYGLIRDGRACTAATLTGLTPETAEPLLGDEEQ